METTVDITCTEGNTFSKGGLVGKNLWTEKKLTKCYYFVTKLTNLFSSIEWSLGNTSYLHHMHETFRNLASLLLVWLLVLVLVGRLAGRLLRLLQLRPVGRGCGSAPWPCSLGFLWLSPGFPPRWHRPLQIPARGGRAMMRRCWDGLGTIPRPLRSSVVFLLWPLSTSGLVGLRGYLFC